MASIRKSGGFSLLEVMIAMLIFSFGLMGLAALQSFSVKNNQSSSFRSQATALSYMIIDNMRANMPAVRTGYYFAEYEETACEEDEPTGATGAETDLAVWRNKLACTLPGGQGSIQFPGDADNTVIVSITWEDSRWAMDPDDRDSEFVMETSL